MITLSKDEQKALPRMALFAGLAMIFIALLHLIFQMRHLHDVQESIMSEHMAMKGRNPHYSKDTCTACHINDPTLGKCLNPDCIDDHEAMPRNCSECHKKTKEALIALKAPILELCTECHPRGGYVVIQNGTSREIDLVEKHPIGLKPTADVHPQKLPLGDNGAITCTTCHDVHNWAEDHKMLRLFVPPTHKVGRGDLKPLCHDCHHKSADHDGEIYLKEEGGK